MELATDALHVVRRTAPSAAVLSGMAVLGLVLWLIHDAQGRLSVRTEEGRSVLYRDSLEARMRGKVRLIWSLSLIATCAMFAGFLAAFALEESVFVPFGISVVAAAVLLVPCVVYTVMLWSQGRQRGSDTDLWDFLADEALDMTLLRDLSADSRRAFSESTIPEETIDDQLVATRVAGRSWFFQEGEIEAAGGREGVVARTLFTADYLAYLLGESGGGTVQYASGKEFAERVTAFTAQSFAARAAVLLGSRRRLAAGDFTRFASFPRELEWGRELPGGVEGLEGIDHARVAEIRRGMHDRFYRLASATHREGGVAELGDVWWLAVAHVSIIAVLGFVLAVIRVAPYVLELAKDAWTAMHRGYGPYGLTRPEPAG